MICVKDFKSKTNELLLIIVFLKKNINIKINSENLIHYLLLKKLI